MIERMKIQEKPVGNMLVGILKLFIDVNGNTVISRIIGSLINEVDPRKFPTVRNGCIFAPSRLKTKDLVLRTFWLSSSAFFQWFHFPPSH